MVQRILLGSLLLLMGLCTTAQGKELPAISQKNKNSFFIPASVCQQYQLEAARGDNWMKVYNNLSAKAVIQRVNDIRWQAPSAAAALKWYKENTQLLGEGGTDITASVEKPAGVTAWNVYEPGESMKQMMEAMGVEQRQFTFTFVVGKYVAKIFVATSSTKTITDALVLAAAGLKAVLTAGK